MKPKSFESCILIENFFGTLNQRPDQYKMKILVYIQYPVWFLNTEVSVFNMKNTE